jgi:outer membrane protein OmpA-like peptidoglycan-associated protein
MNRLMQFALSLALVGAVALPAVAQDTRLRTEHGENVDARTLIQSLSRQAPADARSGSLAEISVALPVHFDFASANLTDAGQALLRVVAAALNDPALIGHAFLIEGHTDSVGSDQANLKLSIQRAEAARQFLVTQGVDGARLTTAGYGELRLIPGVPGTDARQRRVELVRLP